MNTSIARVILNLGFELLENVIRKKLKNDAVEALVLEAKEMLVSIAAELTDGDDEKVSEELQRVILAAVPKILTKVVLLSIDQAETKIEDEVKAGATVAALGLAGELINVFFDEDVNDGDQISELLAKYLPELISFIQY